jgi:hypothetical protein
MFAMAVSTDVNGEIKKHNLVYRTATKCCMDLGRRSRDSDCEPAAESADSNYYVTQFECAVVGKVDGEN